MAAVFKPELLGPASSTSALAALFAEAKPYPHLFVEGVFDDDVLRQAKEELLGGEWFRKRVDLYDFLQTDHLRHAGASGAVARIQNALYGPDFRRWIEVSAFAANWAHCVGENARLRPRSPAQGLPAL